MIDYISWAIEYKNQADKLMRHIEKLKSLKETQRLSLDDIHDLNERIIRLTNLYHDHRLTAKHLRERGSLKGNENEN